MEVSAGVCKPERPASLLRPSNDHARMELEKLADAARPSPGAFTAHLGCDSALWYAEKPRRLLACAGRRADVKHDLSHQRSGTVSITPQTDEAKNTVNTRELFLAACFLALLFVFLVLWGCHLQRVRVQAESDLLVERIEYLHTCSLAGIGLDHVTDAMDPLDSLLRLRHAVLKQIDSLMPSTLSQLSQSIRNLEQKRTILGLEAMTRDLADENNQHKAQVETLTKENESSAALCELLGFVSDAQEIRAREVLAQVQGLETENGNLTSENNDLIGQVDDLHTQSQYLDYIEKNLRSQTEELSVENTDLEADKNGLADQNEELTDDIAGLEADKKGRLDLVEDIKTQNGELHATNQGLEKRKGDLVKENRNLKAIREKLDEEAKAAKTQQLKASKSREVADAKAKTQHEGEIKRLEEEVSRLKGKIQNDKIRHDQEIEEMSEAKQELQRKLQAAKSQDRKNNSGKGSKEKHDQDQNQNQYQNQIVEANKCLGLENAELKTKISCTEKRVEELEGQLDGAETDRAQIEDAHVELEANSKAKRLTSTKIDALHRQAIDEAEARDNKYREEKGQIRKAEEDDFNDITSEMQKKFEAKVREQKTKSDQIIARMQTDQQESQALLNKNAKDIIECKEQVYGLTEEIQEQYRQLATVGLGPLAGAPINASNLPNQGPYAGALPPQHYSASTMYPQGHHSAVPQGQHFPRAFPVNRGQGPYGGVIASPLPMVSPSAYGVPQDRPNPNVEELWQTRDSLDLGADASTSRLVRLPVAAVSSPANSGRQRHHGPVPFIANMLPGSEVTPR
ncbi:MAG: hypothetical protein Q9228_006022 [Teloschistes exilis]